MFIYLVVDKKYRVHFLYRRERHVSMIQDEIILDIGLRLTLKTSHLR